MQSGFATTNQLIKGIDVSQYQTNQGTINWDKVRDNGYKWAIVRAWGSTNSADTMFVKNVKGARARGLLVGAYYFAHPSKADINTAVDITQAQTQADQFASKLQEGFGTGNYGDLIPILDLEDWSGGAVTTTFTYAQLEDWVLAFRDRFESQTGRKLGIYSNQYFLETLMKGGEHYASTGSNRLKDMPLWLSEYPKWYPSDGSKTQPADFMGFTKWIAWQYTENGNGWANGMESLALDRNWSEPLEWLSPPTQVRGFNAVSNANNEIVMAWNTHKDLDVTGFNIYKDGQLVTWVRRDVITYTLTGLTAGAVVKVGIAPTDQFGDIGKRLEADVTVGNTTKVNKPARPTGFRVVEGDKKLTAYWDANDEGTAYDIYVNGSWRAWIPAGTTTYDLTTVTNGGASLVNGTEYSLQLVADNGVLVSDKTEPIYATPKFDAPTNFKVVAGDGQATITWTDVPSTEVTGYDIWLNGAWKAYAGKGVQTKTITGLTNGIPHYWTISAQNASVSPAVVGKRSLPIFASPVAGGMTVTDVENSAINLTAFYETTDTFPDSYGYTSGNHDGQGVSHGFLQWNLGSGTLQPIWNEMIDSYNAITKQAFEYDVDPSYYQKFYTVMKSYTKDQQVAWGAEITDPTNAHKVKYPWSKFLKNLGMTNEEMTIQRREANEVYRTQAYKIFNDWSLFSRRGYAWAFDVAVQNWDVRSQNDPKGGYRERAQSEIDALDPSTMTAEEYEHQKLLILTDAVVDQSSTSAQSAVSQRKTAIANGSGTVYGYSVNLNDYNLQQVDLYNGGGNAVPTPTAIAGYKAIAGDRMAFLTWTSNPDADKVVYYKIYQNNQWIDTIPYLSHDNYESLMQYEVSGLTNGTSYSFYVEAYNGKTSKSSVITVTPKASAPSAPLGLIATGGNGQATIAFHKHTNPTVWGHNLYQDGVWIKYLRTTENIYTITGLTNDRQYKFEVDADNGQLSSKTAVFVTPTDAGVDYPVPNAPTNVVVDATAEHKAHITWSHVTSEGFSHYRILVDDVVVADNLSDLTTLEQIIDVTNNVEHKFNVEAVNKQGESAKSTDVLYTVVNIVPPNVPQNVTITEQVDNSAVVTWTHVTSDGFSHFKVVKDGSLLADNITETSYTIPASSISLGVRFQINIVAVNSQGDESWGQNTYATIVDSPVPTAPSSVVLTEQNDNSVKVVWTDTTTEGFDHYKVLKDGVVIADNLKVKEYIIPASSVTLDTQMEISVVAVNVETEESNAVSSTITVHDTVSPNTPQNVVLAKQPDNSVKATWSHVTSEGFSHFKVVKDGSLYADNVTATEYIIDSNDIVLGQQIKINIVAINTEGEESWSTNTFITVIDSEFPKTPTNVIVTETSNNKAHITWSYVSTVGFSKFKVYVDDVEVGETTSTSFDATVTIGVPHSFKVEAWNDKNQSAMSAVTTYTVTDSPAPNVATGITLTEQKDNSIKVTWNHTSTTGFDHFKIVYGHDGIATWSQDNIGKDVREFIIPASAVIVGSPSHVNIVAKNDEGQETWSANVYITVTDTVVPNAPTNVVVADVSNKAKITWSHVSTTGFSHFQILVDDVLIADNITALEYTAGVATGIQHKFNVVAVNDENETAKSADTLFTVIDYKPSNVPTGVRLEEQSDNSVKITWSHVASEGFSHFRIAKKLDTDVVATIYADNITATEFTIPAVDVPVGQRMQINVIAVNVEGEVTWGGNTYITVKDSPVPNAPTNVQVTQTVDFRAHITWEHVETEGFLKYRVLADDVVIIDNLAQLDYTATVELNVEHKFTVEAWNNEGEFAKSADVLFTVTDEGMPNAPTDIVVTETTDNQAHISWSHVPTEGFSHFAVLIDEVVVADNLTALEYTTTSITPNVRHVIVIEAFNNQGWSQRSDVKIFTIKDYPAPNDPLNVVLTEQADNSVKVTWTHVKTDGLTKFKIFKDGTWYLDNLDINTREIIIPSTAITIGQQMQINVVAVNADNEEAWSENALITVTDSPVPNAPVLTVTQATNTSIKLSWTHTTTTGFSHYRVISNGVVAVDNLTGLETIINIMPNVQYVLAVEAVNNEEESAKSNEVLFAIVNQPVPNKPTNVQASEQGNNDVHVTWEHVTSDGFSHFKVVVDNVIALDNITTLEATLPSSLFTSNVQSQINVVAVNEEGEENWADNVFITIVDQPNPNAPIVTVTKVAGLKARISWTHTSTLGFAGFRVLVDDVVVADNLAIDVTSFDADVAIGTQHKFNVEAYNEENEVTRSSDVLYTIVDSPTPNAPNNVILTQNEDYTVTIGWQHTPTSGLTKFGIAINETIIEELTDTALRQYTITLEDVIFNEQMTINVVSINDDEEKIWSANAYITVQKKVIAFGEYTIVDITDGVAYGAEPKNPAQDQLWIGEDNILRKWNGTSWEEQQLSLNKLDPSFGELTERVDNVEVSISTLDGQISQKVSQTIFDDAVGVNKWKASKYTVENVDLVENAPSFSMIQGKAPVETMDLSDSTSLVAFTGDNIITHLFTNIQMDTAQTVAVNVSYKDSLTVFMNGAKIYEYGSNGQVTVNISLSLRAGWNTVEFLHGNATGTPTLDLDASLSSLVDKLTSTIGVGDKNETRLYNTETEILQTKDSITLKADKTEVTDLGNRISTAEASLTVMADKIESKVEQTDFNKYSQRLSTAESNIEQTAKEIDLKVNQTDYNLLNKKVTEQESEIKILSESISLSVSKNEYDGLEGRVTSAETTIVQHAEDIALRAKQTDLDTTNGRLSVAESSITANTEEIALRVKQSDFDTVKRSVEEHETAIEQNSKEIALKASNSIVSALDGRVQTAEGEIKAQAEQISSRVTKTELEASIDDIKIGGVNLVANSTFNDGFKGWSTALNLVDAETDKPASTIANWSATGLTDDVFKQSWSTAIQIDADGEKEYTVSFDFKTTDVSAIDGGKYIFVIRTFEDADFTSQADSAWYMSIKSTDIVGLTDGHWTRHAVTIKPTAGKYIKVGLYLSRNGDVYWREIKLEEGNKATAWNASNAEIMVTLSDLTVRVKNAEQVIEDDKIVSTVIESVRFDNLMKDKADSSQLDSYATTEQLNSTAGSINESVDKKIDGKISAIDLDSFTKFSDLTETVNGIDANFVNAGGVNKIKNSVGFAGLQFWEIDEDDTTGASGNILTRQNAGLEQLGFGSGFYSPTGEAGYIDQTIPVMHSDDPLKPIYYTLSFFMDKTLDNTVDGWAGIEIFDTDGKKLTFVGSAGGEGTTGGYTKYRYTFIPSGNSVKVRLTIGANAVATITGVMFNIGDKELQWTMAKGEIYNTSVQMDMNGLKVVKLEDGKEKKFTIMTPDKFAGYYDVNQDGVIDFNTGSADEVFLMDEDRFVMKKAVVKEEIRLGGIKVVSIDTANNKGWAFVPSTEE